MSERRGTKALETWCRRLTEGYPGVKVENMTTSWRNGLAFCAIIHHFRPDLIDFASLSPTNIYYNNSLAFNIAERQLGIPALLDAEDMVMYSVPDRLSILTYLSQFYQVFGNQTSDAAGAKQGSSQRIVPKRPAISSDLGNLGMISTASSGSAPKMSSRSSSTITGSRREPCAKCSFPVFLAERLNVGTKLFHRTCFRCARCHNQLSLANYYETETEGQYCCETCPDEEEAPNNKMAKFDSLDNVKSIVSSESEVGGKNLVVNRSLSDEEKSKGLQQFDDDEYSQDFERNLEDTPGKIYQDDSVVTQARNHFLTTHLLNEDLLPASEDLLPASEDLFEDIPPPLPPSKPPNLATTTVENEDTFLHKSNAQENKDTSFLQDSTVDTVSTKDYLQNSSVHENKKESSPQTAPIKDEETFCQSSTHENIDTTFLQVSNLATDPTKDEESSLPNSNVDKNKDSNLATASTKEEETFLQKSTTEGNEETFLPNADENKESSLATVPSKDEETFLQKSNAEGNEETFLPSADENKDTTETSFFQAYTSEETKECFDESSASNVHTPVNTTKDTDLSQPASEDLLDEEQTKDATQSLVKQRMLIFESGLGGSSSISTNNIIKCKEEVPLTVEERSDVADSIILSPSSIREASPLSNQKEESINDCNLLEEYPEDLNPFEDDPPSEGLKKIMPSIEDLTIITPPKPKPTTDPSKEEMKTNLSTEDLTIVAHKRPSTNPFGSSDEDEPEPLVKLKPPRPPQPAVRSEDRKVIKAPRISLNPFWSDDEDPDNEDATEKPVPMPRSKHISTPEPRPRRSGLSNNASHYDSNSSLSSMNSSIGHTPGRKKKPAPAPPTQGQGLTPEGSKQSSPSTSTHPSPKLTPRIRKNRKAPLPPSSTPFVLSHSTGDSLDISAITNFEEKSEPVVSPVECDIEKEKNSKDEKNRNRQSQTIPSPVLSDSDSLSISQQCSSSDKSMHGKWKRKKGPAPARPVPQRRQIQPLPLAELRSELDIIEIKQQGLEKQGVKLEQLIREKCEAPGCNDDTALDPEVEDLVLELFELVNEKNELFRKQAELMYLRRQQRLEEEYADLEYQIRCLMHLSESNKTDSDKAREEELINRLLEVVERRNEIVECLEMDRIRETEEDQSINTRLSELASKKDEQQVETPVKLSKKEKKKMKKEKKLKEKGKNLDVDKDIDESETSSVGKEKKKKKWF